MPGVGFVPSLGYYPGPGEIEVDIVIPLCIGSPSASTTSASTSATPTNKHRGHGGKNGTNSTRPHPNRPKHRKPTTRCSGFVIFPGSATTQNYAGPTSSSASWSVSNDTALASPSSPVASSSTLTTTLNDNALAPGTIAGATIGASAALVGILVGGYFYARRSSKKRDESGGVGTTPVTGNRRSLRPMTNRTSLYAAVARGGLSQSESSFGHPFLNPTSKSSADHSHDGFLMSEDGHVIGHQQHGVGRYNNSSESILPQPFPSYQDTREGTPRSFVPPLRFGDLRRAATTSEAMQPSMRVLPGRSGSTTDPYGADRTRGQLSVTNPDHGSISSVDSNSSGILSTQEGITFTPLDGGWSSGEQATNGHPTPETESDCTPFGTHEVITSPSTLITRPPLAANRLTLNFSPSHHSTVGLKPPPPLLPPPPIPPPLPPLPPWAMTRSDDSFVVQNTPYSVDNVAFGANEGNGGGGVSNTTTGYSYFDRPVRSIVN